MRWPPPTDWPLASLSRQVFCKPHRWHVQETGEGPTLLLLHGAGGSTHSFRDLIPLLARSYHVVALDLPGQGFTQMGARHRSGLDATAEDIVHLCTQERWHPAAIIGHSAGGALALRLSQRVQTAGGATPHVIGINPALDTFKGLAGVLFPVLAKLLSAVPFTAQVFASASSRPGRTEGLIKGTGSRLGADGLGYYRRLIADRDHADATLTMMSQWSLEELLGDLGDITAKCLFIVGDKDAAVPPRVSDNAAAKMPDARVIHMPDFGHLVHEEAPEETAAHILTFLQA